jgi:PilZ domain
MEHLRRYFDALPVLYVLEDGLLSPLYETFSKFCAKMTKLSLSQYLVKTEQLRFALIVIDLNNVSNQSLNAILEKIVPLEALLVCDNPDDKDVLHLALHHRFSAVIGREPNSKELTDKLKFILLSISAKQKEKTKHDQYQRLIEDGVNLFCIKRSDKITFANKNLLRFCGVQNPGELNAVESNDNELLRAIHLADDNSKSVCHISETHNSESYILDTVKHASEQLICCSKLMEEMKQNRDTLTHVEFVELLKDTLIHRGINDEPLFAISIKLENSAKIISDFGSEFFYSFFKKFAAFCGFFFEKAPAIFWHIDHLVIVSEHYDMESVKKEAEQLFAQTGQFKHENDVLPLIELSVVELKNLSINDAISIFDKLYAKNLNLVQSSKLCLVKSSSTALMANGQMAMYHIQNIADKDYKIKLLNIYKGLSISGASKILRISDDEFYVQTEKLQKYLMHIEKNVIIQSEHIPSEIYAEVKYVDVNEPYAILKSPTFLDFSANSRKNARVQCDIRIPVTLTAGKYTFTGELFDLSIQAIAVRYKNKVDEGILQGQAKLAFSLPNKEGENGMAKVSVSGKIILVKYIDDQARIITAIKLDAQNEAIVLEYIYTRQKELITEIKKLGSLIFK